jgi:hypothetical protein
MLSRNPNRIRRLTVSSLIAFSLLSSAGGASPIEPGPRNLNFNGTDDAERNSNMKPFALGVLLGLALTVQAFAIIRPPYPARPMPPHRGHFIVIGDDAKPGQAAARPPN